MKRFSSQGTRRDAAVQCVSCERIEAGGKAEYFHLAGELRHHSSALTDSTSAETRGTTGVRGGQKMQKRSDLNI